MDTDCPTSFVCETNCCRLSVCPGGTSVRFACSTNYQCGSKEKCVFGGCCAVFPKPIALPIEDNVVETSLNSYDLPEIISTARPPRPTSMMPSFGPSDVCEVVDLGTTCTRYISGRYQSVQLLPRISLPRHERVHVRSLLPNDHGQVWKWSSGSLHPRILSNG